MAGSLGAQIERTEERFRNRQHERDVIARGLQRGGLQRGGLQEANSDEALHRRLRRLGIDFPVQEPAGDRSVRPSTEPTGRSGPRAIISAGILERLLGQNDLMPISYLLLGQFRARSVGRIHVRDRGGRPTGFGTGFLVSPRLLLTNNHVLEGETTASFSEVEFDFEADLDGNVRQSARFQFDPAAFFITDAALDFSLVAVTPNRATGREPRDWGWNRIPEGDGLIVKGESVSIIQHPNGEAKQIALRENQIIDLLDEFTHYRTDTAPGSSGSPVFNDQWEVVALHHSGVPDRDAEGNIRAVDGQRWEDWMGEHRIKWIANEGVSGHRIIRFLKNAELAGKQKRLREEMLETAPPLPESLQRPGDRSQTGGIDVIAPTGIPFDRSFPSSALPMSGATWTIPLQITVNLGQAAMTVPTSPLSAVPSAGMAQDASLRAALDELEASRTRVYYDADSDLADRDAYYAGITPESLTPDALFETLSELVRSTHTNRPAYRPSQHVYPWVDLHPDRKLRSIYSGRTFEAEELIRDDFRIEQERARMTRELFRQERLLAPDRLREEIDLLEAQLPFNCEHVVPQSWFNRREPMLGDLHHLFTCESGCNSFRSNIPYYDFPDFEEAVRTACGKREAGKFEPSAGKGAVARATLYFLLRYPGDIHDRDEELPSERLTILLAWHAADPISEYERHRNQAIFEIQGNRNPMIDHPEWGEQTRFESGLG